MKKAMAIMVSMAMLLSILPMVGTSADTEQPQIPEPVVGTTDMFGGGDYVHIELGNNSDFGVIYGTEDNPNSIIIVAKVVKYVGTVEAYDTNGAKIGERTVKVGMIFAQKLDTLVEFNDSNENGIFDYTGLLPYEGVLTHEPIYKRVSLRTAWERSEITKTVEGDNTTWTFSLTAHNLSYIPVGDSPTIDEQVANDTLETLQFTFHLRAEKVRVENAQMPHFRLTMEMRKGIMGRERYRVVEVQRSFDNVTGWKTVYGAKYDQYIDGWDFDPTNENPSLLLVFHSIFAHYVPLSEALWIREAAMNRIGANGTAKYYTDGGEEEVSDSEVPDETSAYNFRARELRHRFIEIDDSWERVGRFTWVSNVTVDGQEMQMHAQIQGGFRHTLIARGQVFTGFGLIGGLVYPGGNQIYHDPEVSGEAFTELGSAVSNTPRIGLILAIMVGTVVIVGAGLYLHKKRKGKEFEDLAESALPEEKRY